MTALAVGEGDRSLWKGRGGAVSPVLNVGAHASIKAAAVKTSTATTHVSRSPPSSARNSPHTPLSSVARTFTISSVSSAPHAVSTQYYTLTTGVERGNFIWELGRLYNTVLVCSRHIKVSD